MKGYVNNVVHDIVLREGRYTTGRLSIECLVPAREIYGDGNYLIPICDLSCYIPCTSGSNFVETSDDTVILNNIEEPWLNNFVEESGLGTFVGETEDGRKIAKINRKILEKLKESKSYAKSA